ncbi:MAG: SRPBCC family protein [Chloroflexota bacterium]
MPYRFSILIAAPPERVFDLFMDLDRMSEWTEGVGPVTDRTGPVDQVGTRYTVWFGPMRSPTEILAVDRPRHVRTHFGNLILKGEADTRFEPVGAATRLTQAFHTRGVVSAIAARLFATGTYKGSCRGELEAFRKIAEREESAAKPGQ